MDEKEISRRVESSLSKEAEKKETDDGLYKEALVREVARRGKLGIDELEEKNLSVCCSGERIKIWDKMGDRVDLFREIARTFLEKAKELSKSKERKDITETIRKTNWGLEAVRYSLRTRDKQIESMEKFAKKDLKEEIEGLKDKQIEEIKEVFGLHLEGKDFRQAEELLGEYEELKKEVIKRETKPLSKERAEKLGELRREIEIRKRGLKKRGGEKIELNYY